MPIKKVREDKLVMDRSMNPERLEGESFNDYKIRRKVIQSQIDSYIYKGSGQERSYFPNRFERQFHRDPISTRNNHKKTKGRDFYFQELKNFTVTNEDTKETFHVKRRVIKHIRK
jgi:hypothetical protein